MIIPGPGVVDHDGSFSFVYTVNVIISGPGVLSTQLM